MGLQHENWTQNPVSKHNSGEMESSTQSPSLFLEEDLFGAKSWRWFRLPSHPVVARPLFLAAAAGASSPPPSLRGLTPLSQSLATPVAVGRRESASESGLSNLEDFRRKERERERFPYDAMPLCGLYCVLEQGSGVAKVCFRLRGIGGSLMI